MDNGMTKEQELSFLKSEVVYTGKRSFYWTNRLNSRIAQVEELKESMLKDEEKANKEQEDAKEPTGISLKDCDFSLDKYERVDEERRLYWEKALLQMKKDLSSKNIERQKKDFLRQTRGGERNFRKQ